MTLPLLLSLLALLPFSQAGPDWARLSLTGPSGIADFNSFYYYANDISIGTPPATESLCLNIQSSKLAFSSDDCAFCPGSALFRPSLSSTYNSTNEPWPSGTVDFNGVLAQDTISIGGVLTSKAVPFSLVQYMSQNFSQRILDGHLGLWVNSTDDTARKQHLLSRLNSDGQLLNPVVGMRFGDTPDTSHITIGALDPNEFEGTMNWVQAETPDKSWDAPVAIKVDGIRGFNGSFLPYQNPLLANLDTLARNIFLPNAWTYMSQDGYTGPVKSINIDPSTNGYGFLCNETGAYVFMSVDINGVSYQIDSANNLLRNNSGFAASNFCNVGIRNFTSSSLGSTVTAAFGLPFLRSVYFAYRFPTDDCPNAYYGFAFPKGANRTADMIAQKPRDTPSASAQCLSFKPPTTTHTVSTPTPQASADQFFSSKEYDVWPNNGQQVRLKAPDELTAGLVRGVQNAGD